MCARSASVSSAFFVCRISTILRPESWPTDSAPPEDFWPTAFESSEASHFSSSDAVMLTASLNSAYVSSCVSVMLQRPRLVDRLAPRLVALDLVLRLVLGRLHGAP